MTTAETVARHMLHLAGGTDEPTPVTPTQLHALLFYAHGWNLATRDAPLFPARFEAWLHGPVEAGVYPVFADYGSEPIARHEARQAPDLAREERRLVEWAWCRYGSIAAWRLREVARQDSSWREARRSMLQDEASRPPIADACLRRHFRTLFEAECRRFGLSTEQWEATVRDASEGRTIPWDDFVAELRASPTTPPAAMVGHGPRGA